MQSCTGSPNASASLPSKQSRVGTTPGLPKGIEQIYQHKNGPPFRLTSSGSVLVLFVFDLMTNLSLDLFFNSFILIAFLYLVASTMSDSRHHYFRVVSLGTVHVQPITFGGSRWSSLGLW